MFLDRYLTNANFFFMQVHKIIDYEEDVYRTVRESASNDWKTLTTENPKILDYDIIEQLSFMKSYKEVVSLNVAEINSKLAFRLYETFGIDEEGITKLSLILGIKFDADQLRIELQNSKIRSVEGFLKKDNTLYWKIMDEGIPKTKDDFKYFYTKDNKNKYVFNDVDVKVLKIFDNENPVEEVQNEHYCALLLDKTNLYSEAGGQVCINSSILINKNIFLLFIQSLKLMYYISLTYKKLFMSKYQFITSFKII